MSARDFDSLNVTELARMERDIARKHIGHFPWLSVIGGLLNVAIWLALWPLVFTGIMPIWLGLIIATINAIAGYLPSHEAQHDIIGRPGSKLHWLNELVGHLSTLPLALPYRLAKVTHRQHHLYTNDPKRDPDYDSRAKNLPHAVWRAIQNRQPRARGGFNAYARTLLKLGERRALIEASVYRVCWFFILFGLAWSGHAIEAAALWWLPHHIGYTYLQVYLSWAPHHPAEETSRYRQTRSFKAAVGNFFSLGMQYHIIHHLHPRIPYYRTARAYWEMKPILKARGANVDSL